MSFLIEQDWTPKFAGQVLPDRTESGHIFLNILPPIKDYQLSQDKVSGYKFGVKSS
jgi:hypothetical protein